MRYALSALPQHLRDDAATYVLDPDMGYVLNHKGTNGFSCFVERTEQERADFRNDVYAAIGFDAEGSEKIMPIWMDTAKMRAEGETGISARVNSTYQRFRRLSFPIGPDGLSGVPVSHQISAE